MRKSAGNGASLRSRPRGRHWKAQGFAMPFAQSDETTGALSTAPRINDVKPAARSEDEKKAPAPFLKRRLKVRRKSEGRRRT
jgi:hypothetical protein